MIFRNLMFLSKKQSTCEIGHTPVVTSVNKGSLLVYFTILEIPAGVKKSLAKKLLTK